MGNFKINCGSDVDSLLVDMLSQQELLLLRLFVEVGNIS